MNLQVNLIFILYPVKSFVCVKGTAIVQLEVGESSVQPMKEQRYCEYPKSKDSADSANNLKVSTAYCGYRDHAIGVMGNRMEFPS